MAKKGDAQMTALQEQLDYFTGLSSLYTTDEFQKYFTKYLRSLLTIQWIKPEDYKDRESFYLDYEFRRARAATVAEILKHLESAEGERLRYQEIIKKYKAGKDKNYKI